MINCVIIEDEPLAQLGLLNLIKPFENLHPMVVCDDVADFLSFREANSEKNIDLIFLDIELPGMNGIDFIRKIPLDVPIVITTAYNQYAIEGYELNVLDYLLKPTSKDRFRQTVSKVESYINYHKSASAEHRFIYIRSEKIIEKVTFDEIVMIEAMRNYVIYHCEKRKLICYNSLKNVESELPQNKFIKVQKSFIVNKSKVSKIEKGQVHIKGKSISINRENKNEIVKKLLEKTS
ncbi:MAG: response regulator transcription factor [Bacteroidetes bacterium]|jgi:DNA-binding LytR/AlgR family response regulator|nr:response regulator transcription factor [Bacteroidota bacterium]